MLPARIEAESYARFSDTDPGVNQGASGSPYCNRADGVDQPLSNLRRVDRVKRVEGPKRCEHCRRILVI